MDERLLVPATRALVDGWCGPVVVDGRATVTWWDNGASSVWVETTPDGDGYWLIAAIASAALDLSRAECRDRVARVVAGLALAPRAGLVDSCTAHTWEWAPAMDQRRWTLSGNGGGRGWEHFGLKSVPALADLDPNDDTRLPDGSRLVDALALAAVARQVLR